MNISLEIIAYSKHGLKFKCIIVKTIELTIDVGSGEGFQSEFLLADRFCEDLLYLVDDLFFVLNLSVECNGFGCLCTWGTSTRIWYCSLGQSSNRQLTKDWWVHEYKEKFNFLWDVSSRKYKVKICIWQIYIVDSRLILQEYKHNYIFKIISKP